MNKIPKQICKKKLVHPCYQWLWFWHPNTTYTSAKHTN